MVTVRQVQVRAEFDAGYDEETSLYDAFEHEDASAGRRSCPNCGDAISLHSKNDLLNCLERP